MAVHDIGDREGGAQRGGVLGKVAPFAGEEHSSAVQAGEVAGSSPSAQRAGVERRITDGAADGAHPIKEVVEAVLPVDIDEFACEGECLGVVGGLFLGSVLAEDSADEREVGGDDPRDVAPDADVDGVLGFDGLGEQVPSVGFGVGERWWLLGCRKDGDSVGREHRGLGAGGLAVEGEFVEPGAKRDDDDGGECADFEALDGPAAEGRCEEGSPGRGDRREDALARAVEREFLEGWVDLAWGGAFGADDGVALGNGDADEHIAACDAGGAVAEDGADTATKEDVAHEVGDDGRNEKREQENDSEPSEIRPVSRRTP